MLVDPDHFHLYQEVARNASESKCLAKRIDGSSLFIEQRRMPFGCHSAMEEAQSEAA